MTTIFDTLRGLLRLILFIGTVITFLICAFSFHIITRDPDKRLKRFSSTACYFCGWLVAILNAEVKVTNPPTESEKYLLVSNHMGFLDILLLASTRSMVFVTSNEMRETPFLGLLCEMGGCIFVERRSRTKILDEMKGIVEVLKKGFRVVLYPEATSTNGEKVWPFKRTLMMAAAHADVPIQPVVINYRKINGDDFNLKWRDHVCWYGDTPFAVAMWKTLTLRSVKAEIEFLEQIYSKPEDDRGLIADKAHALVAAKFVPVKGTGEETSASIEFETDPT